MIHRYRFISEHHATYGVTRLCRVLAVPRRQGYYEWLAAQPARQERAEAEDQLATEIRAVHGEHRGAYGSPRIAAELRRRGPGDQAAEPVLHPDADDVGPVCWINRQVRFHLARGQEVVEFGGRAVGERALDR